eukprot:CAMPEP_0176036000 /NCGR_PEP_ID=MMETSP0120_2-20121206/17825_1 /TAXON_ID=160619 /ORGANISM="Kryptoperidinium foliaceum, Strain CCMP 1326" /LENGTH=281 /DNA_ID=CAMNT_0017369383 /DNA_START=77 /DNA_END=922 /DNA_ORIENTATION=-
MTRLCQQSFTQGLSPYENKPDLDTEAQYESYVKHKAVVLGTVLLVGHLLQRKLLSPAVIAHCTEQLLRAGFPEAIETLCVFLETIGSTFDSDDGQGSAKLAHVFERLRALASDGACSTRTRILVQNLLDKRQAGWQTNPLSARPRARPCTGGARGQAPLGAPLPAMHDVQLEAGASEAPHPGGHIVVTRTTSAASTDEGESSASAKSAKSVNGLWRREMPSVAPGRRSDKYLCRFIVGIEPDQSFRVVSRLIGPRGKHMKEIIAETPGAKLRIRGRGSGYK